MVTATFLVYLNPVLLKNLSALACVSLQPPLKKKRKKQLLPCRLIAASAVLLAKTTLLINNNYAMTGLSRSCPIKVAGNKKMT